MSTFHGLEMAKQALFTQQSALYTTGHNIANANTEGYSRQRVNFQADTAMPAAAKNRMGIPGQIGTGVKAGSIERIRNQFLDTQFRGENSLASYWEKRADALGRVEDVLNDLQETGLSSVMDQFWSSLQDLAVNPTNDGARSVVAQRGIALSDTFNYLNHSLTQIRTDLKEEITQTVNTANIITNQIQSINEQIKALEVNGYVTNDLYDRRDTLIDQLSGILPIEVEYVDSRKNDHDDNVPQNTNNAQNGVAIIKSNGITLVDGVTGETPAQISVSFSDDKSELVNSITIGSESLSVQSELETKGTLNSLIQAYGFGDGEGDIFQTQQELLQIRDHFIDEFNKVHREGADAGEGIDFFDVSETGEMFVNPAIIGNTDLIAASSPATGAGDGSNALRLAAVFEEAGIKGDYSKLIGTLAVQVEDAERMQRNTGILIAQIDGNRQAVSSVSLDEEMTNLIRFQHAYNAAARTMTATDEILDRIINNMGLVGR